MFKGSHILLIITFLSEICIGQLPKTKITPYLQEEIPAEENLIYCSTFQILWNNFKNEANGNIVLDTPLVIVDNLNRGIDAEKYVNKSSFYAKSGVVTDELIKEINNTIERKFSGVFDPISDDPNPLDYIFYSFLYKNLKFRPELESFGNKLIFNYQEKQTNCHKTVNAFGIGDFNPLKIKHLRTRSQLKVYYKSMQEFIVKLCPKYSKDEIILAMMPMQNDLLSSINAINDSLKQFPKIRNLNGIKLVIPTIKFDINHSYDELVKRKPQNIKFKGYTITEALQDIFFQLDEKGAVLKSKAKIKMTRGVHVRKKNSILIFNKPFILMMKRKNEEYPYFVIWIANPEIMN